MYHQFNNINIREILKYAPAGTKLYSPEFGTLYLTHEGYGLSSSISEYQVGRIDYITTTKKEPPHEISQFGGYGQYRYTDIDYLFDVYGNIIAYNHHNIGYNKPMLKKDWHYTYNGFTFISNEGCQLFPDEEKTWKNWQLKFFKKGDLIKVPGGCNPTKEITYVGKLVDHYTDRCGDIRLILSEVVQEVIIDRVYNHYYHPTVEQNLTENVAFATSQDSDEYDTHIISICQK